jgi:toxin ParE1/3/4
VKLCVLRPLALDDRRGELRYFRDVAGAQVACRLLVAMEKALPELAQSPGIGSPSLGQQLGMAGLRTWRVTGLPLSFWHFERENQVDIARLVGQREDALAIDFEDAD